MIDVNIVASENTSKLLEIECQRLDLTYSVSSAPLDEARLYIIDTGFYGADIPFPNKTIAVGDGKELNARCHIPKYFLLSELRQLIREIMLWDPPKEKIDSPKKSAPAKLTLNKKSKSAKFKGREISLSQTEFKLLEALLIKKGDVLTTEEINRLINGGSSNKANVYICFLRKKLEVRGEKIIYSVRGKGFMIK